MKTKPNLGGLRDQLASQLAAIAVAAPPAKAQPAPVSPPPVDDAAPATQAAPADGIAVAASPPAPAAGPARQSPPATAEPASAPSALAESPADRAGQGSGTAVPAGLQVAREALANTSEAAAKSRKPAPKVTAPAPPPPVTSVEVNARLFQEDLEQLALIQDLMKRQTGRISIGMAAAIRVAIRAFQSDEPVSQIITGVNGQDGRGRWSR